MNNSSKKTINKTIAALLEALQKESGLWIDQLGKEISLRKDMHFSCSFSNEKFVLHGTLKGRKSFSLDKGKYPFKWLGEELRFMETQSAKWQRLANAGLRNIEVLRTSAIADPFVKIDQLDAAIKKELRQHRSPNWIKCHLSDWRALVRRISEDGREIAAMGQVLAAKQMFSYKDFFPAARALGRRRLTLYVGPTNSGKTFKALNALAARTSGLYLAPLRLLALEGQEELIKRGRATSLVTGEERSLDPNAKFIASTIEMLDLHHPVDAALIDEVQNLSDPERGWAWTQAIVGAPASEVLMTGSSNAIELVSALAKYLGEELEIISTDRLTPLIPLQHRVSIGQACKPATAIIAFSRREVLRLRQTFEKRRVKASVIYGALSPQVRREEARRFREGETTVLVATDAIGMGLNLPIRTILFSTLTKWDGSAERIISDAQFLQIAGRAGRFGLAENGFVGGLDSHSARLVCQKLRKEPFELPLRMYVKPSLEHLEAIRCQFPNSPLVKLLDIFVKHMSFDKRIFQPSVPKTMMELANILDDFQRATEKVAPFSLQDAFTFACAPVSAKSEILKSQFQMAIHAHANSYSHLPPELSVKASIKSQEELHRVEEEVRSLTFYCWLAYRLPQTFTKLEDAETTRREANNLIEAYLCAQ